MVLCCVTSPAAGSRQEDKITLMLKGRLQPLQNAFVGSTALDTLRDSDDFNQHRHVQ
jgi:hypothetical protein